MLFLCSASVGAPSILAWLFHFVFLVFSLQPFFSAAFTGEPMTAGEAIELYMQEADVSPDGVNERMSERQRLLFCLISLCRGTKATAAALGPSKST